MQSLYNNHLDLVFITEQEFYNALCCLAIDHIPSSVSKQCQCSCSFLIPTAKISQHHASRADASYNSSCIEVWRQNICQQLLSNLPFCACVIFNVLERLFMKKFTSVNNNLLLIYFWCDELVKIDEQLLWSRLVLSESISNVHRLP